MAHMSNSEIHHLAQLSREARTIEQDAAYLGDACLRDRAEKARLVIDRAVLRSASPLHLCVLPNHQSGMSLIEALGIVDDVGRSQEASEAALRVLRQALADVLAMTHDELFESAKGEIFKKL